MDDGGDDFVLVGSNREVPYSFVGSVFLRIFVVEVNELMQLELLMYLPQTW